MVAAMLKVFGDPTRIRLIEVLNQRGGATVGALTACVPVSQPGVSKQLAVLHQAGLVGALLSFACAVLVARLVVTRRALDRRVAMLAVPADSFDPSSESVVRFASGISRSRRALRGVLNAPASAVRLRLDADPARKL